MATLRALGGGLGGLLVLLLAGLVPVAYGQEAKLKRVVLTLRDVKMAVARSPEVKSTAFDVETLLGKKQQADAAWFPQITSLGAIGLSPEAERQDSSEVSR